MDDLFREQSVCIRIYMGVETILDPLEKNTETTLLNPIPIKAIVADLTATQVNWKMPGIITSGAKEITIQKKRKSLLEASQIIVVEGIEYEGWRIDGKLQYRTEGNYIRAYIYRKQV